MTHGYASSATRSAPVTPFAGATKGILEARGRYIAFLDSDDIAAPDRLEVCLPLLESGQADVVYGSWRAKLDGTRMIDGLVDGQVVHSPDCDLDMLLKVCVPCQSTVMVRRDSCWKRASSSRAWNIGKITSCGRGWPTMARASRALSMC